MNNVLSMFSKKKQYRPSEAKADWYRYNDAMHALLGDRWKPVWSNTPIHEALVGGIFAITELAERVKALEDARNQ